MKKLGPYTLLQPCASSNLGTVHLARLTGQGSTLFAVKVIRPEWAADEEFSRVLSMEADSAVKFRHPASASVYGVGQEGDTLYVAMEFLRGQPFSAFLERAKLAGTPISHRVISWIGAEAALALAAAHQTPCFAEGSEWMVHGALAPRSLFLTYDGRVKVLGMGLGQARASMPPSELSLPYRAPEALFGAELAPAWDIYGLGAILYEAFLDQKVFVKPTEGERKPATLSLARPELLPQRLSVPPSVASNVATVIRNMMAREPSARLKEIAAVETVLREAADASQLEMARAVEERMKAIFLEEMDATRRTVDRWARDGKKAARPAPWSTPPRVAQAPVIGSLRPIGSRGTSLEPVIAPQPPERPPHAANSDLEGSLTDPMIDLDATQEMLGPVRSRTSLEQALSGRIGRYRLGPVIHDSDSAVLFRAQDPNLGRDVVVKVLHPEFIRDPRLDLPLWVQSFKREARLAARLSTFGVPSLHDAGRDGPAFFMVYEWVEGEPLHAALHRSTPFSRDQIVSVLEGLLGTLAQVHEQGIVHGDIRASNVVLDASGGVKLIDLSMAHEQDQPPHPLAGANVLVVSPEYLDGNAPTPRSDQFALGMLLYEMLVHQRPFGGVDDQAIREAIRSAEPRPPEALDPRVDPVLAKVCMRLLDKDPSMRFESCRSVLSELGNPSPGRIAAGQGSTGQVGSQAPQAGFPEAFVTLCQEAASLVSVSPQGNPRCDAPRAAGIVAQRLGFDETERAKIEGLVALRILARRTGSTMDHARMQALVPTSLRGLAAEVDKLHDDAVPSAGPGPSRSAQVVWAVEFYFAATDLHDPQRVSPRTAVLAMRTQLGGRVASQVFDVFTGYLREIISALDLSPSTLPRTGGAFEAPDNGAGPGLN